MKFGEKLVLISDKTIEYSFYLVVISVPLVFAPSNYEIFEFPKMLLVYFGASVILTLWSIKILMSGKLNFSPTPLFWPIVFFFGSQIISTIFSIDKITSITGYYSRFNGGLLSTIAFIILYLAAVSNLNRQQILNLLFLTIVAGFITAIWGIPSHFGADPTCKLITGLWTSKCWSQAFDPTLRIFATFGQPNWMAGFLAMAILVLFGFYLSISKSTFQVIGVMANAILFTAFLLTNSRSAALALLISFTIFSTILIFLKFSQNLRINFASIAATLVIFAVLTLVFGQSLLGRVKEVKIAPNSQPQNLGQAQAPSSGPTESGQIRLIVWRGAVNIFKNYPVVGTGPETFGYSYYQARPAEHNLTTEWNFLYNKAHNEFLNYAATTGILGLASFLAIIFYYFLLTAGYILKSGGGQEKKDKILIAGLLAALLSYLIHNFFGFSVVPTGLFFWLILASTLSVSLLIKKEVQFKPKPFLIFVPIIFFLYTIFIIIKFYSADLAFAKGLAQHETGNYQQAQIEFSQALNSSPLPQSLFTAYTAYNLAILSQSDQNLITQADKLAQKSLNLSNVNLTTVRLATNTYLELSSTKQQFAEKTKDLANKLLKLAPTDAETHFQVAQVLKLTGDDKRSEKIIKRAIELKPNYQAAIDQLAEWQKTK